MCQRLFVPTGRIVELRGHVYFWAPVSKRVQVIKYPSVGWFPYGTYCGKTLELRVTRQQLEIIQAPKAVLSSISLSLLNTPTATRPTPTIAYLIVVTRHCGLNLSLVNVV